MNHSRTALALLAEAATAGVPSLADRLVAQAQVHATLALTQAVTDAANRLQR